MAFDAALNLVWLTLGLIAFVCTLRVNRGGRFRKKGASAWLHVVGVALIVAALFPYISATDDVLRFDDLSSQYGHGTPSKQSPTHNLIRLYEIMDAPLACEAQAIAFTLFFVWLVFVPSTLVFERMAPLRAGRSPPVVR